MSINKPLTNESIICMAINSIIIVVSLLSHNALFRQFITTNVPTVMLQYHKASDSTSYLPVLGLQETLEVHEAHQEPLNVFGSARQRYKNM